MTSMVVIAYTRRLVITPSLASKSSVLGDTWADALQCNKIFSSEVHFSPFQTSDAPYQSLNFKAPHQIANQTQPHSPIRPSSKTSIHISPSSHRSFFCCFRPFVATYNKLRMVAFLMGSSMSGILLLHGFRIA